MLVDRSVPERGALLVLAIAVAIVSGVSHLGSKPFWIDESIAVLPAREILVHGVPRSPFDLDFMRFQVADGIWDPSAPLYRYAVAAFVGIVGFSETTTRLFSVLFGALMVVLTAALARRATDAPTAWLAVIVLLTTPDFIDFSREARHFSFVGSLSLLTYIGLLRAEAGDRLGPILWPIALAAALLAHATAYLMLPVVGLYLVMTDWRSQLRRGLWPLYLVLTLILLAVIVPNVDTLPFVHEIGCENRVAGCHPSPWYYLGVLGVFLTGTHTNPPSELSWWALSLVVPLLAMLVGLLVTSVRAYRDRGARLLLLAAVLPLLLLSTRELKFPRYLFYSLPLYAILVARGAAVLASMLRSSSLRRAASAALALFLIFMPYVEMTSRGPGLASRTFRMLTHRLGEAPTDNFERIREKVHFIEENAGRDDVVVTSFDDATLSFYSKRFVHGFLNSRHDDTHFLGLLRDAEKSGHRVIFIDTLERHDYCHTESEPLRNIRCRDKYYYFYRECSGAHPNPVCVRGAFP